MNLWMVQNTPNTLPRKKFLATLLQQQSPWSITFSLQFPLFPCQMVSIKPRSVYSKEENTKHKKKIWSSKVYLLASVKVILCRVDSQTQRTTYVREKSFYNLFLSSETYIKCIERSEKWRDAYTVCALHTITWF